MGFDMYIEHPPEHEEVAYRAASNAFHAAVRDRDALRLPSDHPSYTLSQARVEETYAAMEAVQTSYFRLNIWGMSEVRSVMEALGMLTHEVRPPSPDPRDYGTTTDELLAYSPDDESAPKPVRAFRTAVQAVVDAAAEHPSGIPAYKFSSNDGWLVTPAEIEAALGWWAIAPREIQTDIASRLDWWPEWIRYLRRARDGGGFRVW
ncbi:hypothetical protein [Streptomyces rimosus]|uniref:hypothetical protein n=1 Tax=Streptomyces rimosus TaxID=1927 RepID=UPI0004C0BF71|nr:hypothetical protein [Streptomyces rimosus]